MNFEIKEMKECIYFSRLSADVCVSKIETKNTKNLYQIVQFFAVIVSDLDEFFITSWLPRKTKKNKILGRYSKRLRSNGFYSRGLYEK